MSGCGAAAWKGGRLARMRALRTLLVRMYPRGTDQASYRGIIGDMASLPAVPLTEEEYLRLDRQAETKSEFYDGHMFAMAGGTLNHALIASRAGALLDRQMLPGCRVCSSDIRIRVVSAGLYTYADGSVICGEPQYWGDQRDTILNPLLLVEVLSPSSEAYDRGKKFELYRTITALREYLLVHQDRLHVEHYSKQDDGSWLLREHSGKDDSVAIARLKVNIPLADLYSSALDIA
jgi:Uma2 family endonuclease